MRMFGMSAWRIARSRFLVAMVLAATSTAVRGAEFDLQAAEAHLEAGELAEVEAIVAAYADDDADAAYYLGRVRFGQGEWEEAADLMEEAVDLGRDDVPTNLWLGRTKSRYAQDASMFSAMGAARAAKRAYQRAVELGPEDAEARRGLIGFLVGAPAIAGGDLDEAREQLEVLRGMDEWLAVDAEASILRAEDAEADVTPLYESFIAANPDHAESSFVLGLIYMQAERYADADARFVRTAELEPEHAGVRYQFGKFAAVTGEQLERGLEQLTLYLEGPLDPSDPSAAWANYRLGMIQEHLGDVAAASAAYRAALDLDEDHEAAEEALDRLGD